MSTLFDSTFLSERHGCYSLGSDWGLIQYSLIKYKDTHRGIDPISKDIFSTVKVVYETRSINMYKREFGTFIPRNKGYHEF